MKFNLIKIYLSLTVVLQSLNLAAQNPPTVTPCGPTQDICLTGPIHNFCVQITVFPGLPASIDHFTLDWGDDTAIDTVPGSNNPADQTHPYDLTDFYGTCNFSTEYFIVLKTYLTNGSVLNNSFLLTFYNPPTASFNLLPSVVCLGGEADIDNNSCPTQGLSAPMVDWGDGTPITSETTHEYAALGTYTVTISVSNNCGTDSHSETIQVISPAEANAIAVDGIVLPATQPYIVCLGGGGVVTLDGCISTNESSYNWDVVSGNGYNWLTAQNICMPEIDFNTPGNVTIELTVNNACNQPDEVQLEFEIIEANAIQLQPQMDACLSVSYTPSPLLNDATYLVDGNAVANSAFPIMLGLGQHVVTASLSNECGMQMLKDTFMVTPPEEVEILFPTSDTVICVGAAVNLQYAPFGGDWIGSNLTQNGNSVVFQSSTPGDFLLIYEKGDGACKRTDSLTITVEGIAAQMSDIQACPWDTSVPLNGMPSGGSWTCPQCPACIDQDTFIVANLPLGLTAVQVFYNVSSANGCDGEVSATVEVLAPASVFSITSPPCSNAPLEVDFSNAAGNNFIWRIDGQVVSPPPFVGLAAGQHDIELVAVSGECRDSSQQSLEIIAPPAAAGFVADASQGCPPLEITFSPTIDSSGIENYLWNFNRFPNDVANGFTPPQPIAFDNTTDSSLTYVVSFTVSNECGESSQQLPITVLSLPYSDLGIDSVKTGCSPLGVVLTNRASGNLDSCFWSISDGFTLTSCQDTILRTFFAPDTITNYVVTLTATNECGTSTASDTITVIPPGVTAFYNLDEYKVCAFDSVLFEDASTPVPTSWLWNFGDGTVSDLPDPVHVFDSPNDTFQVRLTVSTGCGSDDIFHTVITLSAPTVGFGLPPYGCQGQPVIGIENFSDPNALYLWEYSDGTREVNVYEPTPVFQVGGDTVSIKLTVTDFPNQCTNSLEKSLYIRNRPTANFILSDTSGCLALDGETINLSEYANTWLWKTGGQDRSASENTGYSFGDLGKHEILLIASYDGVCSDSIAKTVSVFDCAVYIPNAFSPNNDGFNDFFTVYGTSTVKRVKFLKVFDRWGEMVFENYDFPINVEVRGWDGYHRGKQMNPAVFAWLVEVEFDDGVIKFYEGYVTLVK